MIAIDASPPAIYCPVPLPSRKVMIWGEDAAMETMRTQFESKGWTWATVLLGEKTKALVLEAPQASTAQGICDLISQINHGKFGKLSAGFARFGAPDDQVSERRR
jgi:hypothetical protein